jgi:ribosomal protein L23
MPGKKVFVRGKAGQQARGKKAYVHLKKGDKIELL